MTYWTLYWLFFKYGLLCVGGGYVLVPMLMGDLVGTYHWITAAEFTELVAVAQVTPGPIGINAATYTGFRQLGIAGGLVGTAGLLTPALLMVVGAMYFLRRYENSLWIKGALAGLRPAAFGLVMAAVWLFAELAVTSGTYGQPDFAWHVLPGILGLGAFLVQTKTKISFIWIILVCAALGALFCR